MATDTLIAAGAGGTTARRPAPFRAARLAPYAFLTPAFLFFTAFLLIPIGYAIWLSLFASRRTGGGILGKKEDVFVGIENYVRSLTDPAFYQSLGRMVIYGVLVVPAMLILALVFALLLDLPRVRAQAATRIGIFLPYAVPGVIASLLWGFIYLPRVSPIRAAFEWIGLRAPDFFTPTSIFFSVANIAVWGGVGFNMIVMYTALRAVPSELYESARIDGAGERQIAFKIKIPLLLPAITMTALFALISTLQVFNEPQTLMPMTSVISPTWMPLQKVYTDAFVLNNLNQGAATSVILALFTLAISLVVLRFAQRRTFGDYQ